MARPRKNDPSSLLQPIIEQFVRQLASAVEQFTVTRIAESVKSSTGAVRRGPGRPPGSGKVGGGAARGIRPKTLCYFPGCQNIAAPRFGMFCAVLHKNLPQAEKDKYRALHAAGGAKTGKAANGEAKPAKGKPGRPAGAGNNQGGKKKGKRGRGRKRG